MSVAEHWMRHVKSLEAERDAFRARCDQHDHEWKQLRDHMGCDGSDLPQLMAAWDKMKREAWRMGMTDAAWIVRSVAGRDELADNLLTYRDAPTEKTDSTLPPSAQA